MKSDNITFFKESKAILTLLVVLLISSYSYANSWDLFCFYESPSGVIGEHKVIEKEVFFKSNHLTIAGVLRYSENTFSETNPQPAIIVGHPASGVKEQAAGLYANLLSERGFVTLTFDCAYQGDSEGTPRGLEDPAQRVEDFKSAVSFLNTVKEVDPLRIGVLGICASGGYSIAATSSDHRVKALATVNAVDVGRAYRHGADGKQAPEIFQALLDSAAAARTIESQNGQIQRFAIFPSTEEEAKAGGKYVYEGWEYYCTPRAGHPRSAKNFTWSSIDRIAIFDGFNAIETIAPRPLLLIAGREAITKWISQEAYQKAKENKEFYWIDGASHVDLYDKREYVMAAIDKLNNFFSVNL